MVGKLQSEANKGFSGFVYYLFILDLFIYYYYYYMFPLYAFFL